MMPSPEQKKRLAAKAREIRERLAKKDLGELPDHRKDPEYRGNLSRPVCWSCALKERDRS